MIRVNNNYYSLFHDITAAHKVWISLSSDTVNLKSFVPRLINLAN